MHNIKLIRDNPDLFKKKLLDRNIKFDSNHFLELDKKNRQLIQTKEKLEQEKKVISKKNDKSLFSKSKNISQEIVKLEKELSITKLQIENFLSSLPNLAMDDVPIGNDEKSNKEIKKFGNIEKFSFKPKNTF